MAKARQSAAQSAKPGMIVTVDPAVGLESVIGPIRKAGFKVSERMDALNLLTGHGGPKTLSALRKLPGVVSVDRDTVVRLDPREVPDMGPDFAAGSAQSSPKVSGSSWKSPNWDE